jgi:sugar lactone lactonase YvrE
MPPRASLFAASLARTCSVAVAVTLPFALAGCGSGGGSAPATYSVSGTISTASAAGLVIANGGTTLAVPTGSTTFAFAAPLASGSSYNVTIVSQPTALDQRCSVAAGSGTIASANVSIAIACHAVAWASADITAGTVFTAPYVDGSGAVATFHQISSIARDASGNLYVADQQEAVIRKVTPQGVVSTWAGTAGTSTHVDGPLASATFIEPGGLAFDAAGNLYVADAFCVRKISPAGVVSTLAGSPEDFHTGAGFVDGAAADARFRNVMGLQLDAAGNVYVADVSNRAIRKITPDGTVSTLAGSGAMGFADGTGSAATFTRPYKLALDASGNVFVADSSAVRKITSAGVVTTIAGGPADNCIFNGNDATTVPDGLCAALDIAVDANGNVFVADEVGSAVRKISAAGAITTLYGGFQFNLAPFSFLLDTDGSLIIGSEAIDDPDNHVTFGPKLFRLTGS